MADGDAIELEHVIVPVVEETGYSVKVVPHELGTALVSVRLALDVIGVVVDDVTGVVVDDGVTVDVQTVVVVIEVLDTATVFV